MYSICFWCVQISQRQSFNPESSTEFRAVHSFFSLYLTRTHSHIHTHTSTHIWSSPLPRAQFGSGACKFLKVIHLIRHHHLSFVPYIQYFRSVSHVHTHTNTHIWSSWRFSKLIYIVYICIYIYVYIYIHTNTVLCHLQYKWLTFETFNLVNGLKWHFSKLNVQVSFESVLFFVWD